MTHPRDRVYRFVTRAQWSAGASDGLLFAPEGGLVSQSALAARQVASAEPGVPIRLLTADACGRLIWLDARGTVWTLADDLPIRIAALEGALAQAPMRLVWGQAVGWIVADGEFVRLDVRSGRRLGSSGAPGWRVVDIAADRCDGALVIEADRGGRLRLRQICAEGRARVIPLNLPEGRPIAMTRLGDRGTLHVILARDDGWLDAVVEPSDFGHGMHNSSGSDRDQPRTYSYPNVPDQRPGRCLTTDGERRLILAGTDGVFAAGLGLLEPPWHLVPLPGMGEMVDLVWTDGALSVATASGIYAIEPSLDETEAQAASYFSPPLHSPAGPRAGWLRADLDAALPAGGQIKISARGFASDAEVATYRAALKGCPASDLLRAGWDTGTSSVHFGTATDMPLRHYLGDVRATHVALRIDAALPACSEPIKLRRLDVFYPDRSLIEQLPAIYRSGDGSEAQLRRMLAPFQALADEIDDRITKGKRRVDPATADDQWTGFLLSWLGHRPFARLPVARRRALLAALPEILPQRGTLRALARVMDALAPEGYTIEDTGLGPDVWVLPDRRDPAGARLGRETRAAPGAPEGMRLGCDSLGTVYVGRLCAGPWHPAQRCSAEVTVRVFGSPQIEEELAPFADRIVRAFVPAHTRVRLLFGPHRPPQRLERVRPMGSGDDPASLFDLDPSQSLALGAWRLPWAGSRIVQETPAILDAAVIDGRLTLA